MKNVLAVTVTLAFGITLGVLSRTTPTLAAVAHQQISTQDRDGILDVISQYGHTWDNKQAEAWTALFTADAVSQNYHAGELTSEARSRTERLARATERHGMFIDSGIQTRHMQTNTVLTRQPDGSVGGETVFTVFWQYRGEATPRLVHTGVYVDRFVKTDTGWKFARREVRFDHE